MYENLHYESVYVKELHNEQEYYWSTIYGAGAAVVSTTTRFSSCGEISWKGVVNSFCIQNHSVKKIIKFSFKLIYKQDLSSICICK